jgi:hypothetical protein
MLNPKRAATCFYLFLALLLLKNVLQDELLLETGAIFLLLIPMGGLAALANQVAKGQKWAGWIYTVLFLLAAFAVVDDVKRAFENNHTVISVLDLAWVCVFGIGVFFVHEKFLLGSPSPKNPQSEKDPRSKVGAVGSVSDDLTKLHELLKAGALTQQEFEDQKKRLLKVA